MSKRDNFKHNLRSFKGEVSPELRALIDEQAADNRGTHLSNKRTRRSEEDEKIVKKRTTALDFDRA